MEPKEELRDEFLKQDYTNSKYDDPNSKYDDIKFRGSGNQVLVQSQLVVYFHPEVLELITLQKVTSNLSSRIASNASVNSISVGLSWSNSK